MSTQPVASTAFRMAPWSQGQKLLETRRTAAAAAALAAAAAAADYYGAGAAGTLRTP